MNNHFDSDLPEDPTWITWYTPTAEYPPSGYKNSVGESSAVVCNDGRVMVVWREKDTYVSPNAERVCIGYASDEETFVTTSNSVTRDRILINVDQQDSGKIHAGCAVFRDPTGKDKVGIYLLFSGYLGFGGDVVVGGYTFDSSIEAVTTPAVTGDKYYPSGWISGDSVSIGNKTLPLGACIWRTVDDGATWTVWNRMPYSVGKKMENWDDYTAGVYKDIEGWAVEGGSPWHIAQPTGTATAQGGDWYVAAFAAYDREESAFLNLTYDGPDTVTDPDCWAGASTAIQVLRKGVNHDPELIPAVPVTYEAGHGTSRGLRSGAVWVNQRDIAPSTRGSNRLVPFWIYIGSNQIGASTIYGAGWLRNWVATWNGDGAARYVSVPSRATTWVEGGVTKGQASMRTPTNYFGRSPGFRYVYVQDNQGLAANKIAWRRITGPPLEFTDPWNDTPGEALFTWTITDPGLEIDQNISTILCDLVHTQVFMRCRQLFYLPRCPSPDYIHIPFKRWLVEDGDTPDLAKRKRNWIVVEEWSERVSNSTISNIPGTETIPKLWIPYKSESEASEYHDEQNWLAVERWLDEVCWGKIPEMRLHPPYRRRTEDWQDERNWAHFENWVHQIVNRVTGRGG